MNSISNTLTILSFLILSLPLHASSSFDEKFKGYERSPSPGFSALVVKDGKTVYERSFGKAKLKSEKSKSIELSSTTNFNLASNSKQFTAMAILLLEQAGRVNLDDLLTKFIPEAPDYMKPIKIKNLVYHTSGLPDYMAVCGEREKVFNKDILEYLTKKTKLEFPSGSRHEYSNSGYVLLSEIVQRVAKKPFPDFIQEEIFKKLGMTNSYVFSEENEHKIPFRATGYGEWPYFEEKDFSPCNYNFGDGGVYTSLLDYQKWAAFLTNPSALLKPEFRTKFFESGKTESGEDTHYSYGWYEDEFNGKKMKMHTGAWVGFKSFAAYIPEEKLWIILMSNYRGISIGETATVFLNKFVK